MKRHRCQLFPLSKAGPGAYSTYRMHFESCFIFILHVMYYALRIWFLDDDDRLHGSTLPYIILVVDIFIRLDVLCLVDSYR
jgi:hypothetical protein